MKDCPLCGEEIKDGKYHLCKPDSVVSGKTGYLKEMSEIGK